LGEQYGIPYIDLDSQTIPLEVIRLIPPGIVQKASGDSHWQGWDHADPWAMADPTNVFAVDDIKFMTGLKVEAMVATESAVRRAIDRFYDSSETLQNVMASIEDAGMEVIEDKQDGNLNISDLRQAVEEDRQSSARESHSRRSYQKGSQRHPWLNPMKRHFVCASESTACYMR